MAVGSVVVPVDVTARVSAKLVDVLRERLVSTEREATELREVIAKLEDLAALPHRDVPVAAVVHRGRGAWAKNGQLRARALEYYRDLGEGRTIRQVGRDLGIPEDTVTGWARREKWMKLVLKPTTPKRSGPIPVEANRQGKGTRPTRQAALTALPVDEVVEELAVALGECGPLTDRGFLEHCRGQGLFPTATDEAIALGFANAVHDQPKLFRRRNGVVELVQ